MRTTIKGGTVTLSMGRDEAIEFMATLSVYVDMTIAELQRHRSLATWRNLAVIGETKDALYKLLTPPEILEA